MYTPKARRLPSGKWQCRVTVGGQTTSIVRSTKAIAEKDALKIKLGTNQEDASSLILTKAIDRYIEEKLNLLSPTTVHGYRSIQRNRFKRLMYRRIDSISKSQWQAAIEEESREVAPKTVANSWRLMSSVVSEYTGRKYKLLLPKKVPYKRPWLRPDEVEKFQDVIRGKWFEIPALLALHSLRRSEVLAMTWDKIDLENDRLIVYGADVMEEGGGMVHRELNKNETSRRIIPFILPQLKEAVERADHDKPIVSCNPGSLARAISRECQRAGIPEVGMHGLRKSFASLCAHKRIPKDHVRQIGGWASDETLDEIYTEIWNDDLIDSMEIFKGMFK